jgi:serine/threonine protein kinase
MSSFIAWGLQNAETVTQLTNEVKLMSALAHPNIVRVLASESRKEGSGVEIMVAMEYCPGERAFPR